MRDIETEISRRDREKQTVGPIEHTAVTGDEIGEILDADHAFDQRLRQIADLPHRRGDDAGDDAHGEGERKRSGAHNEIQHDPARNGREQTAETTLDRLVRGNQRCYLVLAEAAAADQRGAVAHNGGDRCQKKRLRPDVGDGDDHDEVEEKAGIGYAGQRIESAAAGDLFMQDAGEEGEINRRAETGDQRDRSCMEKGEDRLRTDIDVHDPGAAVNLDLFERATVFIRAEETRQGKVYDPCNGGDQHTAERDGDQNDGGDDSCLQFSIPHLCLKKSYTVFIDILIYFNTVAVPSSTDSFIDL